jgi:hypothetical protein
MADKTIDWFKGLEWWGKGTLILVVLIIILTSLWPPAEVSPGNGDSEAAAGSCDELADDMVALNQSLIDQVGEISVAELAALGGPLAFEDWVEEGQKLAARTTELECGASLISLLIDRADRLHAEGPAGESLIADFKSNLAEE